MSQAPTPAQVAAVDLGSNSFHMVVAQLVNDQLHILDRIKEMVQLGAGLDERKHLRRPARERAIACLERFGERLRDLPPGSVRAVGTNTLRQARGAAEFIAECEAALGHPIEVIAGREEARLVYLGVSHHSPPFEGRRLVMDIGGGSTEYIVGEGFEPIGRESLHMGCVSMSQRFFADGRITAEAMRAAQIAARLQLRPIEREFRRGRWQNAVGASGTILAVEACLRGAGLSREGITRDGLERLVRLLVERGHVKSLDLAGVSPQRGPVFPGGVAVLAAAFQALDIELMQVSDGALREGLLYDMVGRFQHEDVRERTIAALSSRWQVDMEQALRVEATALQCQRKAGAGWGLGTEECNRLLSWAARLHEIGLGIAHAKYHRHGAYLVRHSDMPGFSRQEQQLLGLLIQAHRRKLPLAEFDALPEPQRRHALRLTVLLRLAVLLHRNRSDQPLPDFDLTPNGEKHGLKLRFPPEWLANQPLTLADLAQEAEYLKAAKIKLKFGAQ